jgi:hypothetical protein
MRMKTVKMKTTMAGPGGVTLAGQVIEVDDQTAQALVSGGFAEAAAVETVQAEKTPVSNSKRRGGKPAAHEEV